MINTVKERGEDNTLPLVLILLNKVVVRMNRKEEISALIEEYKGEVILEEAYIVDIPIMVENFLRKYGLPDVEFTVTARDLLENISVYIVDFFNDELFAKITVHKVQKVGLFEETVAYRYIIDAYKRDDHRLLEIIRTFTGNVFMDEYNYKEPETAIRELLTLNYLEHMEFEIETIDEEAFRGYVSGEYKVTFPAYGIMATMVLETTQRYSRGEQDDNYLYSFKEEESEKVPVQTPTDYPLSFWEAAERCLNNEGFIRGNDFAKGVYVRCKDGTLVAIDGGDLHREIGSMQVTNGMRTQKYKLFSVANAKTIGLTD